MRFGFAIASLVLSGVLLILGIGQRTFLAGPSEITYRASLVDDSRYAVIPGDVFAAEAGQSNIVVTGDGAFAAVGSAVDVAAWVAPFTHTEVAVDQAEAALVTDEVQPVISELDSEGDGTAEEISAVDLNSLDPRGSDLWLEERSVEVSDNEAEVEVSGQAGTVRMPVEIDADQAVLISVAEENSTQSELSVVWVQDSRSPLAGPLLVAGGLFALLGGVLYLLAVDHDRRGLGPRRGRKGPLLGIRDSISGKRSGGTEKPAPAKGKTKPDTEKSEPETGVDENKGNSKSSMKRAMLPSLGLVLILGLSGCSAEYWPDFGSESSENDSSEATDDNTNSSIAPVPVTRGQIDRIVTDIAAVADIADDSLNADELATRFTEDALAQRTANYTIRAAVPDYAVIPPRITNQSLGYELVQSTEGWPRTVFVTVASESGAPEAAETETNTDEAIAEEEASPSLAIIMTQANPHENYLVSRVVSLRGGITMPEAAPANEGTALLGDDLQTLMLAPIDVGGAYAAVLAGGAGVEQASLFDLTGDTLLERSGAAWAAQAQATADAAGQGVVYSVSAQQTDAKIISLSTGVGGALVATTVLEDRIEEPGEGRWRPTPSASVTALTGLTGQQDRLVSELSHQLLFFVPSKTSNAPIQLLGFTSDLVGARN